MAKGYIIARIDVIDEAAYARYVGMATAAIEQYGGSVLVRGGACRVLEGVGRARNVVIEFASRELAERYYQSPEYAAARAARTGVAIADFVAVEGAT
ncbi:DUF1330 domain-containing protein [Burkholderia territorii]|uniref:DUF1330 domain-containing protein n=1 Tax=Burkholderia territorii TaxID=1503055 RepID=UPI0007521CF0|nr:DUF1330 domain-containing protein [Burkholderia territorii]KVQ61107.1 hypothetical protein WT22_16825 [Burkholderia territorii]KWA30889.1 hypothetical protein WT40_21670 [Burkholderia territorii]